MEFATAFMKAIVLVPVWALIEAPLIRLSARIVIPRRITFRAAFMLALITGGVLLVVGTVLSLVSSNLGNVAETALSLTVTIAVGSWLFGYFLTNADGQSIGLLKGGAVVLLSAVFFAVILIAVAVVVVGVGYVGKT